MMKFPVLENDSTEELFFDWSYQSMPPEYVNFTRFRRERNNAIVHCTRTYERKINASGHYYTFLREKSKPSIYEEKEVTSFSSWQV